MSFGGELPDRREYMWGPIKDFNLLMISIVETPVNPDCYIDVEVAKQARDKLDRLIEKNKNGRQSGERR